MVKTLDLPTDNNEQSLSEHMQPSSSHVGRGKTIPSL